MKSNDLTRVERDTGYRFVERDPDMEWICNAITESRLKPSEVIGLVYESTNHQLMLHYKTVDNWLNGKTKRPQNYTLTAVARALGYDRVWTKINRKRRRKVA